MADGQSRYGIMESLNSKKIEANKTLAEKEKVIEEQKHNFENIQFSIEKEIAEKNTNYISVHDNWVKNKNYEIEKKAVEYGVSRLLEEQKHNREIETLKNEIKEEIETYVITHEEKIATLNLKLLTNAKQFDHYLKLELMNVKAIKSEIAGYVLALNDLKEVSKESNKN